MIALDGNYGEGGGALVRVALALSTLTRKAFHVTHIRAGRKDAGLKAQHLTAINALKKICRAETNEIQLGSTELVYTPGTIKPGRYEFDIGTAGSISLFLQALLLPCLFAPGKITINIKGGTSGKWASSIDYLHYVVVPHLQRFADIEIRILKRGYYPAGGGEVEVKITPKHTLEAVAQIPRIQLTKPGTLVQIKSLINVSAELEEKRVAERIRQAAEAALRKYQVPVNIRVEYAKSASVGGEAVLWAIFSDGAENQVILGADQLIEKGLTSEEVGKIAAEKLMTEIDSGAAVDIHGADQLIPFMALLPGSGIKPREITNHAKTNIYVVEQFLPVKFEMQNTMIFVFESKSQLQGFRAG